MIRDIKDGMVTMEWYGATVVYPIEEVEDDELREAWKEWADKSIVSQAEDMPEIYRLIELIVGELDNRKNKKACEVKP